MRALVKAKAEPGLWMQEVEIPRPGDHDVLIRVKKTSICGTDLHIYRWDEWAAATVPVPMTVGHEFMGEIVRVGADVDGLEIGMRVSGTTPSLFSMTRNWTLWKPLAGFRRARNRRKSDGRMVSRTWIWLTSTLKISCTRRQRRTAL